MVLIEKIDEFYKKPEDQKERDYFYASEVGDCPRKIFFKITGAPCVAMEPRMYRVFQQGDQVHMRLMSVLYSLGLVTASEVKIPETELFRGRADGILKLDGENYVLEMKSISPYGFQTLTDMPKPEHMKQIQIYMHYFNISKGIILMENKANQDIKEFIVEKNEQIVQKLIEDFTKLKHMVSQDIVPLIPDKSKWEYDMCSYCGYKEHCDKIAKEKETINTASDN